MSGESGREASDGWPRVSREAGRSEGPGSPGAGPDEGDGRPGAEAGPPRRSGSHDGLAGSGVPDGPAGNEAPPPSSRRPALRVRAEEGEARWGDEEVAGEFPLTLLVNDREMATLVCTPTHLEELVLGFLTAEGVLRRDERVTTLFVDRVGGVAVVHAPDRVGALEQEMFGKRYVGSCCGKSRTGFYMANDARTARRVEADLRLDAGDCVRLMEELRDASPLFGRTGGVHNAALATARGLEAVRTDIGRHNTLDKLYGHALREEVALEDRAVVFSGRISSEILLKVSKMGCPVLVSTSAPTDLALEMADELGVTTVGFLRSDRMNVYTHPRRITGVRVEGDPPARATPDPAAAGEAPPG